MYSYPALECKRFLYRMSQDPSKYVSHIQEYTSRTISRLSWGSPDHAEELRRGTRGLLETISPSGAVPNIVAPLAYLPAWLSPWKKVENTRHSREEAFFRKSMNGVKAAVTKGVAPSSYAKTWVKQNSSKSEKAKSSGEEKEGAYVVGMMAIAGAMTIGSPLQSYILAMCHFPWWQKRVREEIESVCGGRCPEWKDREQLPTLRAVMKEVLRWRPPVPTGIPHAVEQDDVYNGYFIPKGATIHAFEWGMTRDPTLYPDPDTFRPERYLSPLFPTYREPLTQYPSIHNMSQWGFGRRTCMGVDIVEQELFLVMGGLAWAFDIRGTKEEVRKGNGAERFSSLLIAMPDKIGFAMVPVEGRGEEVERMWRGVNGGTTRDGGSEEKAVVVVDVDVKDVEIEELEVLKEKLITFEVKEVEPEEVDV